MPKISISLSNMQLVSDSMSRCYTADVDDFRFRLELAQFKKAVNENIGPESPFSETRRNIFVKYGKLGEDGQNYYVPNDIENRDKLMAALDDALSVSVSVPFPDIDFNKLEKLKLPLNASEISILISCGIIKEE